VASLILIVDDNALNAVLVSDYLTSKGYRTIVANDGRNAIELAGDLRPDLVLMDIQMPAMNGIEAIRRIRADPHVRATPVIALTALAMPGDRERCLNAGANEYVSKPVSMRTLAETIVRHLKIADSR
jgi:CheY-like chemotaxis protein